MIWLRAVAGAVVLPIYAHVLSKKEMRSAKLRFATIKILMVYAPKLREPGEECDKAHRGRFGIL